MSCEIVKLEAPVYDGLPIVLDASSLASLSNVSLQTMTWLLSTKLIPDPAKEGSTRRVFVKNSMYHVFKIPKRTPGKFRIIANPHPQLKHVQRQITNNFLALLPTHESVTGFKKGVKQRDTAKLHSGRDVIMTVDIENYFPSITQEKICKTFEMLGFNNEISNLISELVTFHAKLPQGAPSSPAVSNIVGSVLFDSNLARAAKKHGYDYSRYADDLIFSSTSKEIAKVPNGPDRLQEDVRAICEEAGFRINPQKVHIMRKHKRQTVLGQVVNTEPNLTQRTYKTLKAIVFNSLHNGIEIECKKTGRSPYEFISWIRGKLAYLKQVNEGKAFNLTHLFRISVHDYQDRMAPPDALKDIDALFDPNTLTVGNNEHTGGSKTSDTGRDRGHGSEQEVPVEHTFI